MPTALCINSLLIFKLNAHVAFHMLHFITIYFFAFKPIGVLLITFHSHSCWRFRKIQFRISLSWFSICEIISLHRFISFPRAFSPLLPLSGTHRHFALMYWLTATANRNNWQVISRRQKMKKEKNASTLFPSSIRQSNGMGVYACVGMFSSNWNGDVKKYIQFRWVWLIRLVCAIQSNMT